MAHYVVESSEGALLGLEELESLRETIRPIFGPLLGASPDGGQLDTDAMRAMLDAEEAGIGFQELEPDVRSALLAKARWEGSRATEYLGETSCRALPVWRVPGTEWWWLEDSWLSETPEFWKQGEQRVRRLAEAIEGGLLRAIRAGQGHTLKDTAAALGVSDWTLSRWEYGKGLPEDHTALTALTQYATLGAMRQYFAATASRPWSVVCLGNANYEARDGDLGSRGPHVLGPNSFVSLHPGEGEAKAAADRYARRDRDAEDGRRVAAQIHQAASEKLNLMRDLERGRRFREQLPVGCLLAPIGGALVAGVVGTTYWGAGVGLCIGVIGFVVLASALSFAHRLNHR